MPEKPQRPYVDMLGEEGRPVSEEHHDATQLLVLGVLRRYVGTIMDGMLNSAKVHELLVSEQIMEKAYFSGSFGRLDLMGQAEIMHCLGLNSRQRIAQLRNAKSLEFPRPIAELAMGPVWLARDIELFKARWKRRTGRPPKEDS